MPVVVDEPLAVLAVLVGGVEDREVPLLHMRSALYGLPTADVVVRLVDLLGGEAERPEQVELPSGVLVDPEPETLQGLLAEGEHVEGMSQLEDRGQHLLHLVQVLFVEALGRQRLPVDVGRAVE